MRCEVFKYTTDDWYPSYFLDDTEDMLVQVSFIKIMTKEGDNLQLRVCAWGNDDCGLERDFEDERTAWCCFLEVIGLEDVTMDSLIERGFVGA